MQRDPEIEQLLNTARAVGIDAFHGEPATRENLERMGEYMAEMVRLQAALGQWSKWSVAGADAFANLTCKLTLQPMRTPPILVEWDFKRTQLSFLETISGGLVS